MDIKLIASGLGHRFAEYELFDNTSRVSCTEVEWLILNKLQEISKKLEKLEGVKE